MLYIVGCWHRHNSVASLQLQQFATMTKTIVIGTADGRSSLKGNSFFLLGSKTINFSSVQLNTHYWTKLRDVMFLHYDERGHWILAWIYFRYMFHRLKYSPTGVTGWKSSTNVLNDSNSIQGKNLGSIPWVGSVIIMLKFLINSCCHWELLHKLYHPGFCAAFLNSSVIFQC